MSSKLIIELQKGWKWGSKLNLFSKHFCEDGRVEVRIWFTWRDEITYISDTIWYDLVKYKDKSNRYSSGCSNKIENIEMFIWNFSRDFNVRADIRFLVPLMHLLFLIKNTIFEYLNYLFWWKEDLGCDGLDCTWLIIEQ